VGVANNNAQVVRAYQRLDFGQERRIEGVGDVRER
jgi:hypothetical protein